MTTIPDSHADLLDSTALWHIATVGPDGEPQSTPVWVGHADGLIMFSQTKARQKYRNLLADPAIALSATDPENPYRYLEIRGTVVRIDEDPGGTYLDSMAEKYMGVDRYPYHQAGEERVVIVVEPRHTTQMG